MKKDEQDIAFIRTHVRGVTNGQRKRIIYQIIDRRDLSTRFTAMQRTVGFTMSIGAQLNSDPVAQFIHKTLEPLGFLSFSFLCSLYPKIEVWRLKDNQLYTITNSGK